MPDNAKVLFKRGPQASLPVDGVIEDGVFYLTTDTGRLYVGQYDSTRNTTKQVLLNQTIQFDTYANLIQYVESETKQWTAQQKQDHTNDVFYCTDTNMLVVFNGTTWQQMNPDHDTTISGVEFSTTAVSNIATITEQITSTTGTPVSDSFSLQGAGGIEITRATSNGAIVLEGNEYSLSDPVVAANVATVTLNSTNLSTTSNIVLKGGSNVTLSATGSNQIEISSTDTTISGVELSVNDGSLGISITPSSGSPITDTITAVGVVLNNNTYVPIDTISGKSKGAIYSKSEVDGLLQGLNAMKFMGLVGTNSENQSLPATAVHAGDVYVLGDNNQSLLTLGINSNQLQGDTTNGFRAGDMLIATGTEGQDGTLSSITWTFVPSGNDSLDAVNYGVDVTTSTNAIDMHRATGQDQPDYLVSHMSFTGGTNIDVSSTTTSGKELNVTINHATVTTTSTSSTTSSGSFAAISSISATNGHITSYNVETFTPATYDFTDTRASRLINANVVKTNNENSVTVATNLMKDSAAYASSVFKLKSSNITLSTTTAGEAVINFEWGTF